LGDGITTVCEHRQVQPAVLSRQLRGDLDWIVMKALEKKPDDRYATARELAEDVQRHLRNEPIRAKKPSLADRLTKWSSRHRAVVAAGLVVLIVAVFMLSVSTFLIATAYEHEAAERALADAEAQRASASEARAKASDREAREVVGRIVTQSADRLRWVPHVQEIRHDMLEQAVAFYDRFLQERADDADLRYDSALAWLQMGDLQYFSRRTAKASAAYGEAIRQLGELAARYPTVTSYQANLARGHLALARNLHYPPRRRDDAIHSAHRAVELYQQLARQHPANREYCSLYAGACAVLGQSLGLSKRAETAFRQSLDAWSQLPGGHPATAKELSRDASTLLCYTRLLRATYRFAEAEKRAREAIEMSKRALAQQSANRFMQDYYLAHENNILGKVLASIGRFREAEHEYRSFIEYQETTAERYPSLQSTGMTWRDLSNVLLATDRLAEAEDALRRSLQLSNRVAERKTLDHEYEIELGTVHYRLGCLLFYTDRREEAAVEFATAQQLLEKYGSAFPDLPIAHRRLVVVLATCPDEAFRNPGRAVELAMDAVERIPENGRCWHLLGVAQYYAGHFRRSIASLTRSMRLRSAGDAFDRLFLAMACWQRGDDEQARQWYAEAVDYSDNRGWRLTQDFTPLDLKRFRAEAEELQNQEER